MTPYYKYKSQYTDEVIELPINYTPSKNEKYMNEFQLEYFRKKLIDKKNEVLAESIEALNTLREENSALPNDSAKENNILNIMRIREQHLKLIKEIDYALQKIKNNEYGYCEETSKEIGIETLEANPLAITLTTNTQKNYNPKIYQN